jgi:hypothetical protein
VQAATGAFPSADAQPRQKTGEKGWKPNISRDRKTFIECAETRRLRAASGTVTRVESNRPTGAIESISRDIDAPHGQPRGKTPAEVRFRVTRAVPIAEPWRIIETAEPGNMRLNARYGISAVREDCVRSAGASKWPRRNLKSAACGWPSRQAYPRRWSCGRVAEGGGLLNRYRVVKPYRGFESLRLRQEYRPSI